MAKSQTTKNAKKKTEDDGIDRVVSENRKARFDYDILDQLECGIELVGSEVKSFSALSPAPKTIIGFSTLFSKSANGSVEGKTESDFIMFRA